MNARIKDPAGMPFTSSHIRAALRERYKESHAILFEVGNSTGHGTNRHIDALAIGLWPSRGMDIEGFEIKVSRSDWKRELADHAKADAIQRYCDRWWIAAPKGLIPVAELPSSWGLLELDGTAIRVKVQAPKLEALPPLRGFIAAVLRRAAIADAGELRLAVEAQTAHINKLANESAERKIEEVRRDCRKVLANAEAVRLATGIDLDSWRPTEAMIGAVKFALDGGLIGRYSQLEKLKSSATRVLQDIEALKLPTEVEISGL